MPEGPESLLTYATVQTWLTSLQRHRPLAPLELRQALQCVAAFCAYVEQSPDTIIAQCFRTVEHGKIIDSRQRQYYAARIEAFQRQSAVEPRQQVTYGRTIRGFLIHNGVMLQAGWQYA